MLVDLGKSDLGKVSVIGSVDVGELRTVVRYSHIMHISSTVRGVIQPGCDDAFDAEIEAVLPAGTLGAPKLRACQLDKRARAHRRGLYGGAIGYI